MVSKLDQLKAYVEPQVTRAVQRYADENGLTKSQATRHLTLIGLRLEREKQRVLAEAARATELDRAQMAPDSEIAPAKAS